MQQHQCVQTIPFEFSQQFSEFVLREVKKKPACELYNFSSPSRILSNIKSAKQLNVNRNSVEQELTTPQPKKLISNPIEGRALLSKLMFTSVRANKQLTERKEQNQNQKNIHTARRVSAYCKPETQKEMQEQAVNKFNLQLQKSNYYLNKVTPCKGKTLRRRQISLLDTVANTNLYINGTQSLLSSRAKTPIKK